MRVFEEDLLTVEASWQGEDLVLMHVDDREGVHSGLYRIVVPPASRARLVIALGCDDEEDAILTALQAASATIFASGARTWLGRRYIESRLEL